jgi:hypothetical protein
MNAYATKMQKPAAEVLHAGEQANLAVRGRAYWTVGAALAGAVSGAVSGTISNADTSKDAEERTAAKSCFPYPGSMVLCLTTEGRILVWERSLLFGYRKGYVGEFPVRRVTSVVCENEAGLGDLLTLTLDDEASIKVFLKRKDGSVDFADALRSWLPGTP